MKRISVAASLVVLALVALPAQAQDKPAKPEEKEAPKRGFVWNDRPSIVFGEDISVDLTGRILLEWRKYDPDIGEEMFHLRTARIGFRGELTRHFDWEIEREINEEEDTIQFGEWKDVYLEWVTYDAFRIKGGRFKVPFGLEQNTGVGNLDFAYRSLGSTALTPGRDRGVMVFGDLGRVNYEAGVFDDDGDIAESDEPQFVSEGEDLESVGPSFAVRVTGDLFRLLPVGRLQSANVGVAYTSSQVPEGLNSLRGEGLWGDDFFERVYVKGRRQRFGAQFDWTPGPVGVRAEWMQSREQRQEQSNRNEDLSDFIGTAWYVAGTWFVTGEDKDDNINARRPLFRGGIGAIELAVRYEELGFGSASKTGTAFTNPRADHQVPNSDKALTFGVNWTTTKWSRVVVNAIHEQFEDETRAPEPPTTSYWSGLVRLNIVF